MKKEDLKINSLVESLQLENPHTEAFDRKFTVLYEHVSERWRSDNVLTSLARKYNEPESEILSIALDKIYETVQTFYKKEFAYYNYLSRSISLGCANVLKKKYDRDKEELTENISNMENDPKLVDFIPQSNNIEEFQKSSEQRQLLAHLLEKADDKSRQAVIAFSSSKSFLEAAKLLGVDDKTVKRRVEKVAKLFDPSKYGASIQDFFTVPTEKAVSERRSKNLAS